MTKIYFLLDGTPLYQINHSLGLFSSFNTDIIKMWIFIKADSQPVTVEDFLQ